MTLHPFPATILGSSLFFTLSMAQGIPQWQPDSSHAHLVITSSPESAWVMIDTMTVGNTPCSVTVSAPALHRIRIQHADFANWLSGTLEDTLRVAPGQVVNRMYTLEAWTLVVSSPSGAEVIVGDSILGTAPFIVRPGQISSTTQLTLRLSGYEPATANLGLAKRGILRVPLRARSGPEPSFDQPVVLENRPSPLRLYLSGSGAILTGAAAAYFKVKADNANNDYLLTGAPSSASDRDRFDSASGVFLILSQVSLGLFIAFLMSE